MVRKCANFAFALALVLAIGVALARAHPPETQGVSAGFSTPCEPALPAFKATSPAPAVSPFDSTFAAANAAAPAGIVRISRVAAVSIPLPPRASADFPPLFHRPPPAHS